MDLKNIIETELDIPVLELSDPLLPPCATWYQTLEDMELSGDDNATEESQTYDIDIWCETRQEVVTLAGMLKNALVALKYNTFPSTAFSYDNNGKMWRGNINFKHVKE